MSKDGPKRLAAFRVMTKKRMDLTTIKLTTIPIRAYALMLTLINPVIGFKNDFFEIVNPTFSTLVEGIGYF